MSESSMKIMYDYFKTKYLEPTPHSKPMIRHIRHIEAQISFAIINSETSNRTLISLSFRTPTCRPLNVYSKQYPFGFQFSYGYLSLFGTLLYILRYSQNCLV